MRILALVSDAYGGHGGISVFNRGFLSAIAAMEEVRLVKVLPRVIEDPDERIPDGKIVQENRAALGMRRYLGRLLATLGTQEFDLVVCAHINLLPFARLAQLRYRCPLALNIHGIDVDQARKRLGLAYLASRVDLLISVSQITLDRFLDWVPLKNGRAHILPNSIDLQSFTPGEKPQRLVGKYGLEGKRVLLTLGRLAGRDREKGFDEVMEALPELLKTRPDLVYMIAGDGADRGRLQEKARALGIGNAVIFTGRIGEEEKVDHYRLADVYVMPSRGEGFGIVILEALACGVPVIGSKLDGTREALLDGKLGTLIDPGNRGELRQAILEVLDSGHSRIRPAGLEHFSSNAFMARTRQILLHQNGAGSLSIEPC